MGDTGKCARLHGHTARATLHLSSKNLDEHGMVVHFDRLKETVGKWIEENIDHVMLLQEGDPAVGALEKIGEKPKKLSKNPTAENIAQIIFEAAKNFGLPVIKVDVWESESSLASYLT